MESWCANGMAAPLNEPRVRIFDAFNFVGGERGVIKLAKAPVDAESGFEDKWKNKQRKESEREGGFPTCGNVTAAAAVLICKFVIV